MVVRAEEMLEIEIAEKQAVGKDRIWSLPEGAKGPGGERRQTPLEKEMMGGGGQTLRPWQWKDHPHRYLDPQKPGQERC